MHYCVTLYLCDTLNYRASDLFQDWWAKVTHGAKNGGSFSEWWAQAYQTNHSWHLGSILYTDTDTWMHTCWLHSKTCLQQPLKKEDQLSLNAGQKYCRMHSAILSTFIKLPFVIKIFVLSFFEWLLKTCFTVLTTYIYFLFCGVCRLTVR